MHWRYVVSKELEPDGTPVYGIREYYEDMGDIGPLWDQDRQTPVAESVEGLIKTLTYMLTDAASGEVLDLTLDKPRLVKTL